MIARDEARFLERCLTGARGRVEQIVVVDTGSTDETVRVARDSGAIVADFDWVSDFSKARNCSLDLATEEWVLVLDCDEAIAPQDWALIRAAAASGEADAYRITTRNYSRKTEHVGWQTNTGTYATQEADYPGWFPTTKIRLFRNDPNVRFEGALHELIEASAEVSGWRVGDCDVPVHHYGYVEKERQATVYAELAERKVNDNPEDANARYELALAYRDCDRLADARMAITDCIRMIDEGREAGPYLDRVLVHLVDGEIAGRLEDRAGERAAYEAALEIDPDSFQAMNNLGTACLRSGEFETALDFYTRAKAIAPNVPTIQENIRRVKQRMAENDTKDSGREERRGAARQVPRKCPGAC